MLKIKWQYQRIRNACRNIQRVYKGHRGRLEFFKKVERDRTDNQMRFYNAMATII